MKKKGINVNNGRRAAKFLGISLRFSTLEEMELVDRAAKASGLTSSAFVRLVILAVARRILRAPGDRTLGDALVDAPSTIQERKTA